MDQFRTACGATAPLVLEIEGPGSAAGGRRRLPQPFALIGRGAAADVVLDDERVSRRHAYLQVIGGRVLFVDLDSRTGTALDGAAAESGWLEPGRGLAVGPFVVRLAGPAGEVEAGPPPPSPLSGGGGGGDLPDVVLEFQGGGPGPSAWRMTQALALVGASPRCKVRLRDAEVSRFHCALLRTRAGLWAVDLLTERGVTVNGAPVRWARLGPGDTLGLGRVAVRLSHFGGRAATPATRPGPGWPAPAATPGTLAPIHPARVAGGAEFAASEPALALLLDHFARMQQQQMDQFQQMVMMMLRSFHGMHAEQMGLVRAELDRLRELGDEVASLKAEMAARPAYAPPPPPPPPPPPRLANGWSPSPPTPRAAHDATPPPPPTPPPAPASTAAAAAASVPPPGPPPPNIHEWINDRLAVIADEQQTRWQRVLGLLTGGRGG